MKIAIIGGGLTGLAAGDILCKKHDVTIFEKNSYLGGLAASFEHDGKKVPLHYHHVFAHDSVTRRYLKRFKLKSFWKKIKMAICVNKKLYNFTDPFSLLGFNYLSFFGKIRYGLFGLYVYTVLNANVIGDDVDAQEWLNRVAGEEVTKKLFVPLYARNKFNIPLSKISARQFANRLKAKEATGLFGYPVKGLDSLIEGFVKDFKGKIVKNCSLKSVDCKKNLIDGKKYDKIIVTIPLPEFLKVQKGLDVKIKEGIEKIKYCPCVTVVFGTKKMLSNHYWLNILNERIHMIMQHSYLFDAYEEKISWALRYGGSGEDLKLTDNEIIEEYLKVVKKYFKTEIVWSRVFRERYASPVYDKDYFKKMPSKCRDVYFAGIATTYPKIRNMNTALISGIEIARKLL
jgi:protoporphyrinogen oxidase